MQGNNAKNPEEEGDKNPPCPLQDQLFPASSTYGKTDSHSGDKKQQGDPPDVEHRHEIPQGVYGLTVLNKADEHSPGKEYKTYVIDDQEPNGDDPEPVYIESSFCCFHDISLGRFVYLNISAMTGRVASRYS